MAETIVRQVRDRLMSRVVKNSRDCWEWTGTRVPFGYGILIVDGKQKRAHRVAYEEFVGPIPDDALVCHKCDNPPCINPAHLFIGTHIDNAKDRNAKGRQAAEDRHGRWKGGVSKNFMRSAREARREEWAKRVIARIEARRSNRAAQ